MIFLLAVGSKLLEVSPQIPKLLRVSDRQDHLRSGYLLLWVLQVFLENRVVPDNAGALIAIAVSVALDRARFPAIEAIELGTKLVLRRLADIVTGLTFSESCFSRRQILRYSPTRGCG